MIKNGEAEEVVVPLVEEAVLEDLVDLTRESEE